MESVGDFGERVDEVMRLTIESSAGESNDDTARHVSMVCEDKG
jgi:hypothetical protein